MSKNNRAVSNWRRSSFCADGTCLEATPHDGKILVRDSKNTQAVLRFTPAEWNDFLAGVKRGDFF
jgi:uncharacterized protein DUF397